MATDSTANFALTIVDVFSLAGLGTVVIGPVESGLLHAGDEVEIWDGDRVVSRAKGVPELIRTRGADPRSIALRLSEVQTSLLAAGQQVRRRPSGR